MTKYVEYVNEHSIKYPPINKGGICNYNLETNYEMLLRDGYKPLIEAERPEDEYTLSYVETENDVREVIHIVTEEEKAERERQRIAKLTCTKRVFILILQEMGVQYSQIRELIATDPQAEMEWDLCVELSRSNPLLDVMAARLGFDSATVDAIFKRANDLVTPVVQPTAENEEPAEE